MFYRSIPYDPVVKVIIKKQQTFGQNLSQPGERAVELQYIPVTPSYNYTSTTSPTSGTTSAPTPGTTSSPTPESTSFTYVSPAVMSRNRTITTSTLGSGYTCVSDLPDI